MFIFGLLLLFCDFVRRSTSIVEAMATEAIRNTNTKKKYNFFFLSFIQSWLRIAVTKCS